VNSSKSLPDVTGTPPAERSLARAMLAGAFVWGFAEATLFFIIPDVLLSAIALRRRRLAYIACGWAVAGALLGGGLMHLWGASDARAARRALDRVPAVSSAMLERVAAEQERHGLIALLWGPARGTPYKIYAVESGAAGDSLAAFLLVSVPARLVRFLLASAIAAAIAHRLFPAARPRTLHAGWALVWLAVYATYFALFGF
jgi:membrane protein YqaA with SNARE-associated domain